PGNLYAQLVYEAYALHYTVPLRHHARATAIGSLLPESGQAGPGIPLKSQSGGSGTFSNMKTVRSFANEEGECLRHETKLKDTYQLNRKESMAYAFSAMANSFVGLALKVGILYFGGRLVTKGEVSGGELVSFV
ncbi:unnamed protein product, partial [Staurois parvus]